jgi:hypothetical protein
MAEDALMHLYSGLIALELQFFGSKVTCSFKVRCAEIVGKSSRKYLVLQSLIVISIHSAVLLKLVAR